jgi:hypothetical protein
VNVAVTAADYTPLQITNPLDGTPLTIYSQNTSSIGRVDNVLLNSDLLTQEYDGGEVTVTRRFSNGLALFGGATFGRNKAWSSASLNPNDQINADGYDPLDSPVLLNVSAILPAAGATSRSRRGSPTPPASRSAASYQLTRTIVPGLGQTSQDVQVRAEGRVPQARSGALGRARRPPLRRQPRRHDRAARRDLQPPERETPR